MFAKYIALVLAIALTLVGFSAYPVSAIGEDINLKGSVGTADLTVDGTGSITVNGWFVAITADTSVSALPKVGDMVDLWGTVYEDGKILAHTLNVDVSEALGALFFDEEIGAFVPIAAPAEEPIGALALPEPTDLIRGSVVYTDLTTVGIGSLSLDGTTIVITPDTLISGWPKLGDMLEVRGSYFEEGKLLARNIFIESSALGAEQEMIFDEELGQFVPFTAPAEVAEPTLPVPMVEEAAAPVEEALPMPAPEPAPAPDYGYDY